MKNTSLLDDIILSNQNSIKFLFKTGYLRDIYLQGEYIKISILQIFLTSILGLWLLKIILTVIVIYLIIVEWRQKIPLFTLPLLAMAYIYGDIITPVLVILLYHHKEKPFYRDLENIF